jgi:2-methylisocitrate lyase-like PEP mutase family enzyme
MTTPASIFRELHHQPHALLMANAWDVGSAKLLASLGFQAIATSSGASAMSVGKRDGELTRDEALAHASAVVQAVALPVSADLENGFGPAPSAAAETIRLAIAAGLAGGSIEDAPAAGSPPYELPHAIERIVAAVEAVRASGQPFVLTARAENYLRERPDLDDTIRRLQAYAEAGADVLFAPALPDLAAVRAVCEAVPKPVSFMVGIPGKSFTVAELEEAGVKRISFATSFYRAAMRAARDAAKEALEQGTFTYTQQR